MRQIMPKVILNHLLIFFTDSIKQGTEIIICALFYIVGFVMNKLYGRNQQQEHLFALSILI